MTIFLKVIDEFQNTSDIDRSLVHKSSNIV